MTTSLTTTKEFTAEQLKLITDTVAKGATRAELELFLYRCKNMELDPLKPGQIHFVKYGTGPGTIVVGIEGFRTIAARTGKHTGTHREVVRDANGKCIGARAKVYRSDWSQPAEEEVSLHEYSTGRNQWLKMPETMIKKVAEVAALRIAFPGELGGVYAPEEMEQAENTKASDTTERVMRDVKPTVVQPKTLEPVVKASATEETTYPADSIVPAHKFDDFLITVGTKYKGKTFSQLGPENLESFVVEVKDWFQRENKSMSAAWNEFFYAAEEWLEHHFNTIHGHVPTTETPGLDFNDTP